MVSEWKSASSGVIILLSLIYIRNGFYIILHIEGKASTLKLFLKYEACK